VVPVCKYINRVKSSTPQPFLPSAYKCGLRPCRTGPTKVLSDPCETVSRHTARQFLFTVGVNSYRAVYSSPGSSFGCRPWIRSQLFIGSNSDPKEQEFFINRFFKSTVVSFESTDEPFAVLLQIRPFAVGICDVLFQVRRFRSLPFCRRL